ncbi:MAG: hypothetical protein HOO98_15655 [Nitrospira sp.]|nr:hypothetical protein [Nitrospira sp.]
MTALLIRIHLRTVILILSGVIGLHAALASDEFTPSSQVSSVRISVASYERIPINTLLARPDYYQMRDIRITGTVLAMQTETITNRMICGLAHERTTLTVEDDSGQMEILDQGACGKNVGALKAPMLKTGQQINLLVQIMIPTSSGSSVSSVEATIRYIDLVRD